MLIQRRTWQFLCLILLFVGVYPIQAVERGPKGTVRVGVFPVEPLCFVDSQGIAQGLYPDLLREIVKDEDGKWVVEFVPGSWAEGLERLQNGEIELMLSVAFSSERAEIMDFNYEPVVELWGQVFVSPGGSFKNFSDLNGHRVAVMRKDITGSNFIVTAEKLGVHCDIVEYSTHAEIFSAVSKGETDAGVAPQHIGLRQAKGYNLVGSAIIFSPFSVFFASKKGTQHELLSHIDAQISNWKKDPDSIYYDRLNHWIGLQKSGTIIPVWLIYVSTIGVFVTLLFVGFTVLLRRTVRSQTRELRESEITFRKLFEDSSEAILLLDDTGVFTECNQAALDLLMMTREQLLFMSPAQISPEFQPDGRLSAEAAPEMLTLACNNGLQRFDWTCVNTQGGEFIVEVSLMPVVIKGQKMLHATWRDITERKRAAEALERSEERFRQIITTVREGILRLDAEWRITFANSHLAEMFGYELDELIGQPFELLLHDEDLEDFARRKNERHQGQNSQFERRFRTKDGRELWAIVSASAVLDKHGFFGGSFGTITDITDRKRAEDVLRASERRASVQRMALSKLALHPDLTGDNISGAFEVVAKSIAETLDIARTSVWILSEDGSKIRCHTLYQSDSNSFSNGAELETSALPRYLASIMAENRIDAEDAQNDPRTGELSENYLKPQGITSILNSGIVIDGCLRGVVCSEHVGHMRKWHPDEEAFISTVSAMVAQLYVNSARKRVEEEREKLQIQLIQAQKMDAVGQLAGGVAHDFNNMLGVIIGYSELILQQMDPSQTFYAELTEILKAAARSADLTRQLLTFARKQTVDPRVLDLNQSIKGILKMLRRLIGENINLIWIPGPGLWPVSIDPSQIDQILANLCVNARDAIKGVGTLTVETQNATFDEEYCSVHAGALPGEYVRIVVSDSGEGMDKETLPHIFEPFFTTKQVGEGTGLGLATVYGAVKQNNGYINVYSEPGHGTTITICLPRHIEATEELSTATTVPVVRGDEIVMLVEDEPSLLQMSKMMLECLGYSVLAAKSPSEAIRLADEYSGHIHLLATDVIMPEMNGRELSARLRDVRPEMKCLYMSGYTANIIAKQGVLNEGMSFIQKPFSVNELASKVREAMTS